MKKYIIVTDTCSDLEESLRTQYDIEYIPMHFVLDGTDYVADLDWSNMSPQDFYNAMRQGKRFFTAQVNATDYKNRFEQYITDGYDILSISCSSGLSASVNASYTVRDELLAKYPESKIFCIDSLSSSYGLGVMCIVASELRAEGKSIEEVAAWLEENKLNVNQECTVEDLSYLRRAGRVSTMSAVFGNLLSIKPIIISDAQGQNFAVEKVKGRANSIEKLAERLANEFHDVPYQKVFVCHADSPDAAEQLKNSILRRIPTVTDIHIGYIGPIVGASCGPGTVAAYCFGDKVTVNSK